MTDEPPAATAPTIKELALGDIRTDGGTQMRAELSREVYMDYRDKFIDGVKFPPLDVFYDGSTYWLADGFHRFYGQREAGVLKINCTVHNGTIRDAILFAVAANDKHGLRRSNADKRNSVLALLNDEEWVKWSDRKIADQAGVSVQTVCNVRTELSKVDSSPAAKTKDEPKIGRDGKSRKAKSKAKPTAKITKAAAKIDTITEPPISKAKAKRSWKDAPHGHCWQSDHGHEWSDDCDCKFCHEPEPQNEDEMLLCRIDDPRITYVQRMDEARVILSRPSLDLEFYAELRRRFLDLLDQEIDRVIRDAFPVAEQKNLEDEGRPDLLRLICSEIDKMNWGAK